MRAAKNLKSVLLELGGKAPLLVLEDADLDEAAKAAAFGAFMNQGQICMSTERIIVVDEVADAFAKNSRRRWPARPAATRAPAKPRCARWWTAGPVRHVQSLAADALAHGAVQLTGGTADGVLMPATVIDHVTAEMRLPCNT